MADDEDAKANQNKEETAGKASDVFEPSTAQKDAERRAAEAEALDNSDDKTAQVVEHRVAQNPTYGVEEGYGYLGTDPIYQNGIDARQRPFKSYEDWQRSLMVDPADDAGQVTLPYVPGTRPGGPAVEMVPADHDWTDAPKSDSQEGDDKGGKDKVDDEKPKTATKSTPAPAKSTTPAAPRK